jgi:hypothetical protein
MSNNNIDMTNIVGIENTIDSKQIITDSWSNELEDLMKSWGEKAAGNRELHEKTALKWKRLSERLYLPLILSTTFSSISSFSLSKTENIYMFHIMGYVNVCSTLLAGLIKYYKPDERAQKHILISKQYFSLYRQITLELGMNKADRQRADLFCKWTKQQYDKLLNDSPFIPGDIVDQYISSHKLVVNKPDVSQDSYIIKIFGRDD